MNCNDCKGFLYTIKYQKQLKYITLNIKYCPKCDKLYKFNFTEVNL